MSGIPETISKDLARFFHRKLVVVTPCLDYLQAEPEGYDSTWDGDTRRCVLRHVGTGISVSVDPLDLVERVDRRKPPAPAAFVYCYLSRAGDHKDIFAEVARIALTRPREAWKHLVEHGVLSPIEGTEDEDGRSWYSGPLATLDPSHVFRRTEHRVFAREEEPWHGADFCIAFHVPASCIRATPGNTEVVQLREPSEIEEAPENHVEVDYGMQLIEAASRRDPEGVRACLEAGADPNFVDMRGWTALHAASSIRPKWEVFDLLLPVCNVIARTHQGLMPVNLADKHGQDDTAAVLRERMRQDPKGKNLVT
jgi:hypothetical protein